MTAPNLCEVMRQWRHASGLELKIVSQAIGVTEPELARFERGLGGGGETLAKVMRWLLAEGRATEQPELPIQGEEA